MIFVISLLLVFTAAFGAVQVDVIKPHKKKITLYYKANGTTKAKAYVNVKPEVDGTVEKVYVNEGQRVKKGQMLAQIETSKYQKDVEAQTATVNKLKSVYEYNKTLYQRKKYLYEKNLISENEFLVAKKNYLTAKNDLQAGEKSLEKLKIILGKTKITSPIAGILNDKYVHQGDYVNPNTKMFYIFKPESIVVEFMLPQRFFFKVKEGQKIKFEINDKQLTGKVIYKSKSLTKESLFKVQLNPDKSIPAENLFVKVYVPDKTFIGFEIPERAIHMEKDKVYVFTVINGTIKKKKIHIVSQRYGKVITDTPFSKDELIVVDAPIDLNEGEKVETHLVNF